MTPGALPISYLGIPPLPPETSIVERASVSAGMLGPLSAEQVADIIYNAATASISWQCGMHFPAVSGFYGLEIDLTHGAIPPSEDVFYDYQLLQADWVSVGRVNPFRTLALPLSGTPEPGVEARFQRSPLAVGWAQPTITPSYEYGGSVHIGPGVFRVGLAYYLQISLDLHVGRRETIGAWDTDFNYLDGALVQSKSGSVTASWGMRLQCPSSTLFQWASGYTTPFALQGSLVGTVAFSRDWAPVPLACTWGVTFPSDAPVGGFPGDARHGFFNLDSGNPFSTFEARWIYWNSIQSPPEYQVLQNIPAGVALAAASASAPLINIGLL